MKNVTRSVRFVLSMVLVMAMVLTSIGSFGTVAKAPVSYTHLYGTDTEKSDKYGLLYMDVANSSSGWGGFHVNEYDGGTSTNKGELSMNVDGARKVFAQGLSLIHISGEWT